MRYAELLKEDISYRQYACLIAQMALYGKKPVKVLRYINNQNMMFIVIMESPNGTITSKKITMPLADAVFFTQYLGQDFPQVDFEGLTIEQMRAKKVQGA